MKAAHHCLCRLNTHLFEAKAAKNKAEQTPCCRCSQLTFSFCNMFAGIGRKQVQETQRRKYSSLKMDLGLAKLNEAKRHPFSQVQGFRQMSLVRVQMAQEKPVSVPLRN